MPIVQAGSLNTTALIVPDLYVQIVPPSQLNLNGVPTDVVGVVGTATWGPVGLATIVATMSDYAATFGALQPRKYDMGTQVATAVQQGARNFRCVRVTDGTDTAAALVFAGTAADGVTLTSRYTGSGGNLISASLSAGSQLGTWRVTIGMPGLTPEVFDNIAGTGAAFWTALVNAVTIGTGNGLRGPSQFVTAAWNGAYAAAPAAIAQATLVGGTDGAANVTTATLIGTDIKPRQGMYALRGQGCGIALLADSDDPTQWTTQSEFGLSEEAYMILVAPAGSPIQNGATGTVDLKHSAGLDSYAAKLLHGDWLFWNDPVNGLLRMVSPQGFAAGTLANLSPEQSSLNKQVYGIAGSQTSGLPGSPQAAAYADADLAVLIGNGIDVICNPVPGGSYWGARSGHNSSSDATRNGDNYTRLTNYIATTLAASMGLYVGALITPDLFLDIKGSQTAFLSNMQSAGMLGSMNGKPPFAVVCDLSNNPFSMTSLGYVRSDAQIQYQAINEKFIVNIQGGQTVQVSVASQT